MSGKHPSASVACRVSIIVPTHARPERLLRLLVSLARAVDETARCELVIVDDGSPVPVSTQEIAGALAGTPLLESTRVLVQAQNGPAAARNRGAREASGNALVFIDDDCTVESAWLEELLRVLDRFPNALVASRILNGFPDSLCASVSMSLLHVVEGAGERADGSLAFVASAAIACRRADFLSLGGFDTRYPRAAGEDRAFCRTWRTSGRRILRAPLSCVLHHHALDLSGFWRQQSNYGRGAARFRATHPPEAEPPMPAGFHRRLLLHPLRRTDWSWSKRMAALGLVALSQLAIVYGLLSERRISG